MSVHIARYGRHLKCSLQARGQMFFWRTPLNMRMLALYYPAKEKKIMKTKLSNQKFIHLIWFPNNIAWFPYCFGETGKWEE